LERAADYTIAYLLPGQLAPRETRPWGRFGARRRACRRCRGSAGRSGWCWRAMGRSRRS